jgi:hypothetical protein
MDTQQAWGNCSAMQWNYGEPTSDAFTRAFATEICFADSAFIQVEHERGRRNEARIRWLILQIGQCLAIAKTYMLDNIASADQMATMRQQLKELESRLRAAESV